MQASCFSSAIPCAARGVARCVWMAGGPTRAWRRQQRASWTRRSRPGTKTQIVRARESTHRVESEKEHTTCDGCTRYILWCGEGARPRGGGASLCGCAGMFWSLGARVVDLALYTCPRESVCENHARMCLIWKSISEMTSTDSRRASHWTRLLVARVAGGGRVDRRNEGQKIADSGLSAHPSQTLVSRVCACSRLPYSLCGSAPSLSCGAGWSRWRRVRLRS